ncbi:MAG: acyl carrier protein [bacterium]|nr:acyl carrier protein [bacterium]
MDVEKTLRELLLPVLGLDSIEEIKPELSLVNDLDADSIDFVEIVYVIEQNFGVVLKTDEILAVGAGTGVLFEEGKLTPQGAASINANLPGSEGRYKEGMTKMELFASLTVSDLAGIISLKMTAAGEKGSC